jgi:hypothetical protein
MQVPIMLKAIERGNQVPEMSSSMPSLYALTDTAVDSDHIPEESSCAIQVNIEISLG